MWVAWLAMLHHKASDFSRGLFTVEFRHAFGRSSVSDMSGILCKRKTYTGTARRRGFQRGLEAQRGRQRRCTAADRSPIQHPCAWHRPEHLALGRPGRRPGWPRAGQHGWHESRCGGSGHAVGQCHERGSTLAGKATGDQASRCRSGLYFRRHEPNLPARRKSAQTPSRRRSGWQFIGTRHAQPARPASASL